MIRRALISVLILIGAFALAGCDGDDTDATSTPASTADSTATATPEATQPAESSDVKARLTTDPALDEIIVAINERDVATLASLIDYREVACTTAEGLGGPPKCPEGADEGTRLRVFPSAACEGYWSDSPVVLLGFLAREARGLYAAVAVDDTGNDFLPASDHYLVFHRAVNGNAWGFRLHVADGRIVAVYEGCGVPAADLASNGEIVAGEWTGMIDQIAEDEPRTGADGVDAVLAAVDVYDLNALVTSALMGMETLPAVGCVDHPDMQLGAVPCVKDEAPGTAVVGFPVAYCEGALARDPAEPLRQFMNRAPALVTVVDAPSTPSQSEQYPPGAYWAIFEFHAPGSQPAARLHLTEAGDITAIWYGCDETAETLMTFDGESLPVILDAR